MLNKLFLAVSLLLALSSSHAHLFTPANESDQELLSELYIALGVVPPRYDIVTKPATERGVELFSSLFTQPNGQVSRYAIPLLNSALRYWMIPPNDARQLLSHLEHFEEHHPRLVKELDRELAEAKWLLGFHQFSGEPQNQYLTDTLINDQAHRKVAYGLVLNRAPAVTSEILAAVRKSSAQSPLNIQLHEAEYRLGFSKYFSSMPVNIQLIYIEGALNSYLFSSGNTLANSVNRFEWLCSVVAALPDARAGELLDVMQGHNGLNRQLQVAARRYLDRWLSQRKLSGSAADSIDSIKRSSI